MKRFFVPVLLAVSLTGMAAAQDATPPAAPDARALPALPEPPAMPALAAMLGQAAQAAPPAMPALSAMLAQAAQPTPPAMPALAATLGQAAQPAPPAMPALAAMLGQAAQPAPPAMPALAAMLGQAAQPAPPAMPALAAMLARAAQPAPPAMPALAAMLAQAAQPAPPAMPAQAAQPAPPTPPTPPVPMPMDWYAVGKGSYLGIGVQEITAERTRQLKLSEPHGVEVTHVSEDSPAAKAGLKTGDVVLEFNGQRVEGVEQFVRLVRETPPGRSVKLLVDRDGGTQTVTATVGDRKTFMPNIDPKAAQKLAELGAQMQREFGNGSKFQEQMKQEFGQGSQFQKDMEKQFGPDSQFQRDMQKLKEDMKNMHWDWDMGAMSGDHGPKIGVEIEPVGPQLAEFFGVKQGILVRAVTEGSAAAKAGLKAGDVIVKVAGSEVASPKELTKLLAGGEAGKPVSVTVVRDKREMTMDVTPSTSQARR